MAAPRNRRHIIIPSPAHTDYKAYGEGGGGDKPSFVPASRPQHGASLKASFAQAIRAATRRRTQAGPHIHGEKPGTYLQFKSQPGETLNLNSLEDSGKGIELVAVTQHETKDDDPKSIQVATVFVPPEKEEKLSGRLDRYSNSAPKQKGERRYESQFDPVATLGSATLESLWTDLPEAWPGEEEVIWWEVWLRRHDGDELQRFMEYADQQNIKLNDRRLQFSRRIVVLAKASRKQLAAVLDVLGDVAEVQRAKETAQFFISESPAEQSQWVSELLARTSWPQHDAPAVCVLDTGMTSGHPLFEGAVSSHDCTTVDQGWGAHDDCGHGTEMGGLALYGDLTPVLTENTPVDLRHCLESVKILPPVGENPPELYAAITAEATSRAEINRPDRRRCFSMAITSTDTRDRGRPTSWSVAIDALAAGRMFDSKTSGLEYLDDEVEPQRRLYIISAGNVGELEVGHLDRSDAEPVHDPAQAWNALTVGAFTTQALISDDSWSGWEPLAQSGELSPWSTTSVAFEKGWPLKPDVVFEGGNVVRNAQGQTDFPCDGLNLLTTYYKPAEKSFVVCWATSAATAQAARMAAIISADSPQYWPESVRALIVHSARWTSTMEAHFHEAKRKRDRINLVRRYGFGVPQINRALRSANDALTLVAQASLRPFNNGGMREMHFYELPWPKEELLRLAGATVKLRVTLSYFVEPNPGRRGWTKRHIYASHGLRFDLIRTLESPASFRKRKNKLLLDEEEDKPKAKTDGWYLGEARDAGSIHSDVLECTAADLAERGMLAVFPVGGWWKHQPKRDRSEQGAPYSLIVSIETDAVDADIWSPVAVQVGLPIETAVDV